MQKIAVTGASGIIGSRLCDDLAKDHEVVRLDVRGVEKPVDVGNLEELTEAFKGCESVVHLARAGGGVEATWKDTHANINGTRNAFEAARLAGCKRVIFASSNHAVGMYEIDGEPGIFEAKNGTLLRADTPFRADGYYGVWKAFGEVLGRYYSDKYGLQVACLRIGNIAIVDAKDADELVTALLKNAREGSKWKTISPADARKRVSAIYMSHRDFANLVRAIVTSDVPYGVVYGVSDNATRFWDLEEGRRLYGFWPQDGMRD